MGDLVLAIGNPFGVGQTVTSGIVSALARTDVGVSDYSSFIQTDASINPGNSGGALVDMQGRLVGVNSIIFSRGGGSNGVGFAIPAEMVKRVVDAAVDGGTLVRPWLGAKGEVIDSAKAAALGLDRPRGVLIARHLSPAARPTRPACSEGDVVLTVDGREVFDDRGMKFIAATKAEGETVDLSHPAQRPTAADRRRVSPRRRARRKAGTGAGPGRATRSPAPGRRAVAGPGRGARPRSVQPRRHAGLQRPAAARSPRNVGFQPGDIVREINGAAIRTKRDFDAALKKRRSRAALPTWRLAIERNGQRIESELRGRI